MPAASSKVKKEFNYDGLDADSRAFVQQQTVEIRRLGQRVIQDVYDIGQKLILVKEKMGHGSFTNWLAGEFGWSERTAQRFMNVAQVLNDRFKDKSDNLSDLSLDFDLSALYYVTAPNTPVAAREELFAIAQSGEKVTYTKLNQVKHKYSPKKVELEPNPELEQLSPPSSPSESEIPRAQDKRSKPEIVAFIPRTQEQATANRTSMNSQVVKVPLLSQPSLQASVSDAATWWALDGKHLLFCGDPNSNDFLQKIPTQVSLLLAFPTPLVWQHSILAVTSFIVCEQQLDKVMKEKKAQDIYTLLETMILDYSEIRCQIVICFLPSSVSSIILNTTNCLERRAIIAEPNRDRCRAAIDYWKKSGGKVERLTTSPGTFTPNV